MTTDVNKSQLQKLGDKVDKIVSANDAAVVVLPASTVPIVKAVLDPILSSEVNQTGSVGMKYDGGKILANILFDDFALALEAISIIGTYGAKKYARNSWLTVPDAPTRYKDAMVRHQLAMGRGEVYDDESNLLHAAHFAWNALATLQLLLKSGVKVQNDTATFNGESPDAIVPTTTSK